MPRPVAGCDLKALPLSPQDAFVLSRIDGFVSESDLTLMTGLAAEQVRETLERLADLGAVTWDGMAPRNKPKPSGSPVAAKALAQMEHPAVETFSAPRVADEGGDRSRALYDPAELDEDVELPPDKRRRILDLYYQLEELSYYELLGVEQTADKKAIKSAYYELAGEFHPDKHFRKRLGSFKSKMEAIFSRVTLAHDTLTRKVTREEYDAYLATQRSNRRLEASLRDVARITDEAAKELAEFVRMTNASAASPSEAGQPLQAQVDPAAARPATQPPPSSSSAGTYQSVPVRNKETEQARRQALAAKLGPRSSKPPASGASAPPPVDARRSMPPEQAAEELRRRMHERQEAARRQQVARYVEAATVSMQHGDAAAAANAYRLALAVSPDDPVLKEAFAQAEASAAAQLADGYLKQAAYEEKAERWKEAALSYMRAAAGMKDNADVQHRVAVAMLRANMDLRRAAEHASRAIALEPRNAAYHATLAQIYLTAGMPANARREAETAAELAPKDASIASLLKAVRKNS